MKTTKFKYKKKCKLCGTYFMIGGGVPHNREKCNKCKS